MTKEEILKKLEKLEKITKNIEKIVLDNQAVISEMENTIDSIYSSVVEHH